MVKMVVKMIFLKILQLFQHNGFPPPPPTCYLSHLNAKGIGYTNLTITHHQNKMDMDHHIYQQNLNVKQHFRFSDLN